MRFVTITKIVAYLQGETAESTDGKWEIFQQNLLWTEHDAGEDGGLAGTRNATRCLIDYGREGKTDP